VARTSVALIGIGNVLRRSSRGSNFTAEPRGTARSLELWHLELGGYHIGDIEFVATLMRANE
jgi:hypothetical protein